VACLSSAPIPLDSHQQFQEVEVTTAGILHFGDQAFFVECVSDWLWPVHIDYPRSHYLSFSYYPAMNLCVPWAVTGGSTNSQRSSQNVALAAVVATNYLGMSVGVVGWEEERSLKMSRRVRSSWLCPA